MSLRSLSVNQPTPQVTRDDVLRIIRRDFPADQQAAVLAILDEYGAIAIEWQREAHRVHLAILKLANGDLEKTRRHTNVACGDYRDVLAPAEYADDLKWERKKDDGDAGKARAMADDWDQFQRWSARE